jgi:hypothetical protein
MASQIGKCGNMGYVQYNYNLIIVQPGLKKT